MMPKKAVRVSFPQIFNLQQLLEFAKDYHPNRDFVYWYVELNILC